MSFWDTDTITLQTSNKTKTNGAYNITWNDGDTVLCDVQSIHKEKVLRLFGFDDSNEWLEVFDPNPDTAWVEGERCKYEGVQYRIRKIEGDNGKMSLSNHTYILLSKVI